MTFTSNDNTEVTNFSNVESFRFADGTTIVLGPDGATTLATNPANDPVLAEGVPTSADRIDSGSGATSVPLNEAWDLPNTGSDGALQSPAPAGNDNVASTTPFDTVGLHAFADTSVPVQQVMQLGFNDAANVMTDLHIHQMAIA